MYRMNIKKVTKRIQIRNVTKHARISLMIVASCTYTTSVGENTADMKYVNQKGR